MSFQKKKKKNRESLRIVLQKYCTIFEYFELPINPFHVLVSFNTPLFTTNLIQKQILINNKFDVKLFRGSEQSGIGLIIH